MSEFTYINTKLRKKPIFLNIVLFCVTIVTTIVAGTMWANKDFTDLNNWHYGLEYSFLILLFLTAHEFGHYFAARKHNVDSTLPYYIPMPFPFFINFGTFGAVIKTRSPINSRKALFDIGIAGPLAGFVVCVTYLIIGLSTLPGKEFIYQIHPEYLTLYNGEIPTTSLHFGDTLMYYLMSQVFANPNGWLPPMNDIYHYPLLNVGWFGLFVTTLNLLPFGQLDGGHITYAMFGKNQGRIARIVWWVILIIGIGSLLHTLYLFILEDFPNSLDSWLFGAIFPVLEWIKNTIPFYMDGWGGWLFWALITRFYIKLDHPQLIDYTALTDNRKLLGWISIIILLLSFSYNGIYFVD